MLLLITYIYMNIFLKYVMENQIDKHHIYKIVSLDEKSIKLAMKRINFYIKINCPSLVKPTKEFIFFVYIIILT